MDAQRCFAAHGIKGECGHITFPADCASIEVPVAVKTVFMGMGIAVTPNTLEAAICSCSNEVKNGKVVFRKHGPHLNDEATLNYQIYGW